MLEASPEDEEEQQGLGDAGDDAGRCPLQPDEVAHPDHEDGARVADQGPVAVDVHGRRRGEGGEDGVGHQVLRKPRTMAFILN